MLATIAAAGALLTPGLVAAQTKIAGTVVCGKPDPEQRLAAADGADHVFAISQGKCSWTKPMDIAGSATKEDSFTNFAEFRGDSSTEMGFGVGTLASGDKFHVRIQGKATTKAETAQSSGTWKFEGGTGKINGIKGGGTYKCSSKPEGNVCEVTGDYTLPK
jgi:hypothetical protein